MIRSIVLPIICLLLIGGAVAWLVTTQSSRSPAAQARHDAGWRMCHDCGHEWHMKLSEIAAEIKRDPTEYGYVHCPKCGAWRGMARVVCPKCDKAFTAEVEVETGDGSYFAKRDGCPHCGYVFGSEAVPDDDNASE